MASEDHPVCPTCHGECVRPSDHAENPGRYAKQHRCENFHNYE